MFWDTRGVFATQAGWGTAVLRVVLAAIFIREGSGKLLGWFGGQGFAAACAYFQSLGIPFAVLNTFLVSSTEFFGGILLLVGFLTRLAAIPIAATMIVAILTAHRAGGWEYPVLIVASCLLLIQAGAGSFSVDEAIGRRKG